MTIFGYWFFFIYFTGQIRSQKWTIFTWLRTPYACSRCVSMAKWPIVLCRRRGALLFVYFTSSSSQFRSVRGLHLMSKKCRRWLGWNWELCRKNWRKRMKRPKIWQEASSLALWRVRTFERAIRRWRIVSWSNFKSPWKTWMKLSLLKLMKKGL